MVSRLYFVFSRGGLLLSKLIEIKKYKKKPNGQASNPYKEKYIEKQTNKLYILIGIPCSGKSTYANRKFNVPNTIIVSTDEIRKELTGTYRFSQETNNKVFEIANEQIQAWLVKGFNVVFDATNTNKKYRKKFINIGEKNHAKIIGVVFNTPIRICLMRNSMRDNERKVPDDVILKMSNFNSDIDIYEGFDEVIFVGTPDTN